MGNINISISGSLGSYTTSFIHMEGAPFEAVYVQAAVWLLERLVEQQAKEAKEG